LALYSELSSEEPPFWCGEGSSAGGACYTSSVLLFDAPITLREALSSTRSPTLAEVFRLVLSSLKERSDIAIFGAQAVNAYVDPPRMTSDVDVLSTNAENLAEELRDRLSEEFRIAVRVRTVAHGRGFRVYQIRRLPEKNRHLVDVRQVDELPNTEQIDGIDVVAPIDLIVMKLESFVERRHTDKGISDRLDLHRLLLAFPEFRHPATVTHELELRGASPSVQKAWAEILSEPMRRADDDEY